MGSSKIDALRARLKQRLDELEAMLALTYRMNRENRAQLIEARGEAGRSYSWTKLNSLLSNARAEVERLGRAFGARVGPEKILSVYRKLSAAPQGEVAYIRKSWISELFSDYGKVFPQFDKFPPHGFLLIPTEGESPAGRVDWFLLEAKLFEDMCGLFNQHRDRSQRLPSRRGLLLPVKYLDALWVATVSVAFYFAEAYLNGLAVDYLFENRARIAPETAGMLVEWDMQKNRRRYLSLREKALQYPKIILGLAAPPLQESNCPELAFVCDRAKRLRDAVAHPSPIPDFNANATSPTKEEILLRRDSDELELVVDNVVCLVRKLELLLAGDTARVPWLLQRDATGFFPNAVFK
jgi:hypothetical protein